MMIGNRLHHRESRLVPSSTTGDSGALVHTRAAAVRAGILPRGVLRCMIDAPTAYPTVDLQLPLEASAPHGVSAWGIPLRRTTEEGLPTDDAHTVFREARAGRLIRVRPGVFAPADRWNNSSRDDRFFASAAALALTMRSDPVFCRETALLLYGLPLINRPDVLILRAPSTSMAGSTQRKKPPGADWPLFAERRISVPRAWNDLAPGQENPFRHRISPGTGLVLEDLRMCLADTLPRLAWEDAVVVADALRGGLRNNSAGNPDSSAAPWTAQELDGLTEWCTNQKNALRLKRIFAFSSPRSGSPGESWSRVIIDRLGFEPPELQHEVRDINGRLLGILDFWWKGLGLAGEFDGKKKYAGANSYSGRGVDPVILAEKLRSERIQEEGIRFVRWMWDDLKSPRQLETKLRRAGVPQR